MLTKSEQNRLSSLLALTDSDDALTLCELEGYLFGLAITPEAIVPSEWMPPIFGGEMPTFDSMKAETLTGTLMRTYNRFCTKNYNDELFFPFEGKKLTTNSVGNRLEWAYGFQRALLLRPRLWTPPENDPGLTGEQHHDIMMSHAILIGLNAPDEISNLFVDMDDKLGIDPKDTIQARASLLTQLHHAVTVLQWYSARKEEARRKRIEQISRIATPTTSEKIGRNGPCPCGSGKKFKKCCG